MSSVHPDGRAKEPGYDLAMHLVGMHKNSAAIFNSAADNAVDHHHEHFGPCGIRNHPFTSLAYDDSEVEAVLEEAENPPRTLEG